MPRAKKFCVHISFALGLLFLAAVGVSPLAAQSGLITQGFRGNIATLSTGALVSLGKDSPDTVELSDISNAERLVGIVNERAFLEFSDTDSTVQVVLDGSTPTLVSDLNGEIRTGDRVTVSPIAGVGMKASQSLIIVGVAQADLSSNDTTERTITDRGGQKRSVSIGLIPVQINVAAYVSPESSQKSDASSALQDIASTIAGRPVSPTRAILATTITIVLFSVIVVVLYSSVRSSIISIGRNPLSEHSLRKGMVQVGLIVLGIAIVGLGIVYAVLRF